MAESVYGFARDSIATQMIGHEGVRFAPYFATLFCFILLTNLFGIIPLIQISPNSHIAFPIILAVISYVMFNYVGIRKHGFWSSTSSSQLIRRRPWYILPLLVPIEFFSTFIVRPVTLSAASVRQHVRRPHDPAGVHARRLRPARGADLSLLKPVGIVSWAMAIALTFLEALVTLLQAYVFVVLTSSYIAGALAEEH